MRGAGTTEGSGFQNWCHPRDLRKEWLVSRPCTHHFTESSYTLEPGLQSHVKDTRLSVVKQLVPCHGYYVAELRPNHRGKWASGGFRPLPFMVLHSTVP